MLTYLLRITLVILLLPCFVPTVSAQQFSIQDGQFIDPDGEVYVPIGANVNAWNYFDWQQNIFTPEHQDIWTNCWNFNFMRVPVWMYDLNWEVVGQPKFAPGWVGHESEGLAALRRVVDIYTAKKVVVMINAHDFICRWPTDAELEDVKAYFRIVANEFKDNPYVWFNLFNEPGFEWPVPPIYRDMHQEVIEVIRDEVGAENMVVCTGSVCGQEDGTWTNNPIPQGNSAFLTYGNDLINFNDKTYDNIAFDLHMYDQWAIDSSYLDVKLRDFLDRMKANDFAMLIGEVGSPPEEGSFNSDKWDSHNRATELAYNIALKEYGIGIVQWHYDPEDDFALVDGPHKFNRGIDINDCANPTNLTYWGGEYFWRATHEDGFGLNGDLGPPPPPTPQTPFEGAPQTIPGIIEVEDYDNGGSGTAYRDIDASNNGAAYRPLEGVDIEPCSEGGFNIGWTDNGEWIELTVAVATAGAYEIDVRHAGLEEEGSVQLSINDGGPQTAVTALPPTGDWQTFTTTTVGEPITLDTGTQVLRVDMLSTGFNLNHVTFRLADAQPPGGNAHAIEGRVEAEDFMPGGQGIGYNDTSPANEGGEYRPGEGVDIEETSDEGGGYHVGYIITSEWLAYEVNVTEPGMYAVNFRVAGLGGTLEAVVGEGTPGAVTTGNVTIPSTGDFQTWRTVTAPETVTLAAGPNVLRLNVVNSDLMNLNYVEFSKFGTTSTPSLQADMAGFQLYPNPASSQRDITLVVAPAYRSGTIEVIDLNGRVVHRQLARGADRLRVTERELPAGTYMVRLVAPAGQFVRKLVVR